MNAQLKLHMLASTDSTRLGFLNGILREGATVLREAVPITGPFGLLPPELIDAIASMLIRVPPNMRGRQLQLYARWSAGELARMLCACKGFSVISAETRAEAIARGPLCMTPAFWKRQPHPFLAQALCEVEAFITVRALLTAMRHIAVHCAREHCGGSRRLLNCDWVNNSPLLNEGPPVVRKAVDGRTLRLDVAWKQSGALMCTSDAGALVMTHDGSAVKSIEASRARVLSPNTDLHVPWTNDTKSVFTAASRGDLVAMAELLEPTLRPTRYALSVWDMKRNVRLCHVEELQGHLEGMWFLPCMTLVRLFNTDPRSDSGRLVLQQATVSTLVESPQSVPSVCMATNHHVVSHAFSEDAGEIALLFSEMLHPDMAVVSQTPWSQHAATYTLKCDTLATRIRTIEFAYKTTNPHRDSLAIAPAGDVLVVCGRGHIVPSFHIYKPLCDGAWGMLVRCRVEDAYHCNIPEVFGGSTSCHFSPCGSLLIVLVHDVHTGMLVFNIRDIKDRGERTEVHSQFFRIAPAAMPRHIKWRDGLWLQTRDDDGVLRLGFS